MCAERTLVAPLLNEGGTQLPEEGTQLRHVEGRNSHSTPCCECPAPVRFAISLATAAASAADEREWKRIRREG